MAGAVRDLSDSIWASGRACQARLPWLVLVACVVVAGCKNREEMTEAARRESCETTISAPLMRHRNQLAEAIGERNQHAIARERVSICVKRNAYVAAENPQVSANAVLSRCSSELISYVNSSIYRLNNPPSEYQIQSNQQIRDSTIELVRMDADLTLRLARHSKCWMVPDVAQNISAGF